MLTRIVVALVILAAALGTTLWAIAAPDRLPETAFEALGEPDLANGELIFNAGNCASCHGASEESEADDAAVVLTGGHAIESDFGTFHVPNISSGPEGIGDWSFENFANAMLRGVAPDGSNYYPAFPYASYSMMDIGDVNDLWGYLRTLPASENEAPPHEVSFPFNVNRAIGIWKYLYMPDGAYVSIDPNDMVLRRGQYLVEAVGHCGECHTPRDMLGGLEADQWLAGAPNPSGQGTIPNITPAGSVADWSADDLAYFFESGFTPDFDSVGGSMVAVQRGLATLPASDREAISAYLKAIPEH